MRDDCCKSITECGYLLFNKWRRRSRQGLVSLTDRYVRLAPGGRANSPDLARDGDSRPDSILSPQARRWRMRHTDIFQVTGTASSNARPTDAPKLNAVDASTNSPMPMPNMPHRPLVMTAALARPPIRACRISIVQVVDIGYTATMPAASAPPTGSTAEPPPSAYRPGRCAMAVRTIVGPCVAR